MKLWSQKQIDQHKIAAEKLKIIKNEFANFIATHPTIDELSCVKFIKNTYKKHGLTNDHKNEFAIVAFGESTKEVHYFPTIKTNKRLSPDTLILLDIWARLSSSANSITGGQVRLGQENIPYADATFMFYFKSKSKAAANTRESKSQSSKLQFKNNKLNRYKKVWKVLSKSRDNAINYIKKEIKKGRIPRGLDIDRVAHDVIGEAGLGRGIKHTVGHSLGFDSPHGKLPGINWREYSPIQRNVGYTIEPGIYLENFGMRTEIDFYVDNDDNVIITTPLQKEIEII